MNNTTLVNIAHSTELNDTSPIKKFNVSGALYNDIALLILDTPVTDAENIGIVCLPPVNEEPPSARCYASGWGKDVFGKEGKYQVILKRV